MSVPKCVNPKGAQYCIDENCPARGADGRHVVAVSSSEDLNTDYKEKFSYRNPTVAKYGNTKKPLPTPTGTQKLEPIGQHPTDTTLFDINDEWFGGSINFYVKAAGLNPVFYVEPDAESTIVARVEGGRKRDVYIVAKGNMRVKYGNHVIRSSKQLISIGVNSDSKLNRAVSKNLIEVLQVPKFEAVDIRYLGRKDESRTPILPANQSFSELLFAVVKHLND